MSDGEPKIKDRWYPFVPYGPELERIKALSPEARAAEIATHQAAWKSFMSHFARDAGVALEPECPRVDVTALPPVTTKILPQVWRYSEPSRDGEGWWVAFIDSQKWTGNHNGGHLSIQSDWGNYSYCWGGVPADQTLPQFLVTCGRDYILNKLARCDWVDVDASKKKLRARVLEYRRENRGVDAPLYVEKYDYKTHDYKTVLTGVTIKEEVARVWAAVDALSESPELLAFLHEGDNAWLVGEGPDAGDYYLTDYEPQARAFMDKVWPRIVAALKADGHGPVDPDKGGG